MAFDFKTRAHLLGRWFESLRLSQIHRLTFVVPGHADVRGNKRADQLVDSAVLEEEQIMDRAGIISATREAESNKEVH